MGRNATKAQFEAFWGVTLAANVLYLNAGDTDFRNPTTPVVVTGRLNPNVLSSQPPTT